MSPGFDCVISQQNVAKLSPSCGGKVAVVGWQAAMVGEAG
jgi:hypothetical protein